MNQLGVGSKKRIERERTSRRHRRESKKRAIGNSAKSSLPLNDINNAARSMGSYSGQNRSRASAITFSGSAEFQQVPRHHYSLP